MFKNTAFRRLGSISVFRQNLLSWAQSIELVPISGRLYQPQDGYASQAQHKPSARVDTKQNIKNSTRMNYHDRSYHWRDEFSVWYQHKKHKFLHLIYTGHSCCSNFCCDNGSPDARDVQTGMTDRMVYQRHVGGFLVFSICCVWFILQDLRFIPTYFVAFFVRMLD
jgi:hypothetical protein